MSGSVRARSDDGLRQAFVKGIVVVVAVFIALAGIIHLANNGHSRPEGVAEDWLASVGDTTRKGVKDESVRRAEKIGPVSLAGELLRAAGDTKGKRAFTDLEVGKAAVSGGGAGGGAAQARVPYHLHLYEQDDARDGAVVLEKQGEDWRVVAVGDRPAEEKVPSEGGAPPSSAPSVVWVAGLALGLVITALASVAVRAATPAAVS